MVTGPLQTVAAIAAAMAMRWSLVASTRPWVYPVPSTIRRSSSMRALPPKLLIRAAVVSKRSVSFSRSRPAFVKTAPFFAPATTAKTGTRSGVWAASMVQFCSSFFKHSVTKRSPWAEFWFKLGYVPACLVTLLCLTLCNPMDCGPPGFSVLGISQARKLEWVAISFSRGASWPRDGTCISCIGRWILHHWAT